MRNIFKKATMMGLMIMCFGLFAACGGSIKITDFDGLKDLPRNPVRIVFATNSQTFDGEPELYGEPIEYEIQSTKIVEVTEQLFAISYKALDKNIQIDISPIIRTLTFYNAGDAIWTVRLGLQRHNEHWYSPTQDEALITLLYESIKKKTE